VCYTVVCLYVCVCPTLSYTVYCSCLLHAGRITSQYTT